MTAILTIWMYGIETLKLAARFAFQTIRTLVAWSVPKSPLSVDRFQTPAIYFIDKGNMEYSKNRIGMKIKI